MELPAEDRLRVGLTPDLKAQRPSQERGLPPGPLGPVINGPNHRHVPACCFFGRFFFCCKLEKDLEPGR